VRLAFAVPNFPPEFLGGTERVALGLAKALQAEGDEVLVLTGSDRPHAGRDVEASHQDGLEVLRVPRHPEEHYGLDVRRARVLGVVEDLLIAREVDVLHVHHWATLSIRLLRSARALGLGAVATLHDMWTSCPRFFRRPPPGIRCPEGAGREACVPCAARDVIATDEKLRRGIGLRDRELQQELAAAHALTAPSQATAELVAGHVPWRGPIEVVPHGLLEPPRGNPHDRDLDPSLRFRVGTFGNLVPDKGVMVLIEAMAGLDADLHLHGPFLEEAFEARCYERAAQLGVLLFGHGAYSAAQVHPARHLDVAVFPSLCQETYGLVVEEALARGVPVVVSDRGALRERVGGGGVVVPAGDVAALHAVLADLLARPARLAALRRGIPGGFRTVADAARRYRELYERARLAS
jgi:glycosyltransferase involved in cell wall biosynthesis